MLHKCFVGQIRIKGKLGFLFGQENNWLQTDASVDNFHILQIAQAANQLFFTENGISISVYKTQIRGIMTEKATYSSPRNSVS